MVFVTKVINQSKSKSCWYEHFHLWENKFGTEVELIWHGKSKIAIFIQDQNLFIN